MKKLRKIINKNKSTTKKTQFQALSTPPLNRYNCKINKIIHNQSICMKKKWKDDKENAKNGNFRTYTDQWREERSRHGSKRDQKRGFKGIGIGFLRRDVAGDSCKLHGWSDDDLCSPIGYSSTTEGEMRTVRWSSEGEDDLEIRTPALQVFFACKSCWRSGAHFTCLSSKYLIF